MNPVEIYIGGQQLLGWTEMTLQRAKKNMTGSLSVTMFFSYIPKTPVATFATSGKEILVYIGGHLAFTGKLDKRTGTGHKKSDEDVAIQKLVGNASISAEEYKVTLSARGKTKYLIDSSHQHKTTNMLQPTNKEVVEELIKPWGIPLEWKSKTIKLDKVRFRDGAIVADELHRVASENCHFCYETRDGKLRFTDATGGDSGEPLILGENILTFSTSQGEEKGKKKIKVKGQRTKKGERGRAAIIPTSVDIENNWITSPINIIVQHFGDATNEALRRRGRFEANKRDAEDKKISVTVFHVQNSTGEPWDIGKTHYVEIPPEGIADEFECTDLTYTVKADKTIQTSMTLSPKPAEGDGGSGADGSALPRLESSLASFATQRRASLGITFEAGKYPAPWTGPILSVLAPVATVATVASSVLQSFAPGEETPPLKLPEAK